VHITKTANGATRASTGDSATFLSIAKHSNHKVFRLRIPLLQIHSDHLRLARPFHRDTVALDFDDFCAFDSFPRAQRPSVDQHGWIGLTEENSLKLEIWKFRLGCRRSRNDRGCGWWRRTHWPRC